MVECYPDHLLFWDSHAETHVEPHPHLYGAFESHHPQKTAYLKHMDLPVVHAAVIPAACVCSVTTRAAVASSPPSTTSGHTSVFTIAPAQRLVQRRAAVLASPPSATWRRT